MRTVNRNPDAKELRSFGWVMLAGFALIGALAWYSSVKEPGAWLTHGSWAWTGARKQVAALAFWALASSLWGVSLFAPKLARPVYVVWMTAAGYMGLVSS